MLAAAGCIAAVRRIDERTHRLPNSLGNLALALNQGDFAARFGISSGPGWRVTIKRTAQGSAGRRRRKGGNDMQLQVNGASLRVEVDGSPQHPALLLWQPGRCTLRVWDHLVPRLTERFRVLRVDVRGFGQSAPADADEAQFNFEQYAADADAVLDHFGIERCHVWSQSWGTRAAIVFCALNPQRVLSAALYAVNTGPADVPAQREGTKRSAEERRKMGIETPPMPDGIMAHADAETARRATQAHPHDLAAMVPGLIMPVLIATGSHDPNLASSRVAVAEAPRATLRVLTPVGHNAILEHPQLALDAFLEFHDSLAR